MQFDKLFQVLTRADVKELALQGARPPCALVGDQYAPIVKRNFSEEEVIAVLVEAGGQSEVVGLIQGQRRWDYTHPGLGVIRVTAGYHGERLQARFKLIEAAPKPAPVFPPTDLFADANREPLQPQARPNAGSLEWDPAPEPAKPHAPPAVLAKPRAAAEPERAKPAAPFAAPVAASAPKAPQPPAEPASVVQQVAPRLRLDANTPHLMDALLKLARSENASDLHVLADRAPNLRIAGDLVPVGDVLSEQVVEEMLLAIVPAGPRSDLDQHGACDFAMMHPSLGRFRANVTRQRTGYKLTARPIHEGVRTLEELGLPKSIGNATKHHQGLIVVTGPTGHGKTTTLAAIVDLINREHTHHIITVEDPIEYVHPPKKAVISQRQVGSHTKTFAAALKGSLREDPDVIVVGELRDAETVRMALSASETGHLVISTMNTPSAAKAIERIIDLFPPGDQPQVRMTLAGGLRLIISQRLIPSADRRTVSAAAELLPGSSALWALIRDNKTFQIPSLQQRGKALGIIRLDDSLADLVRSGRTSFDIAREFAESPDQFETLVGPLHKAQPANKLASNR